MFINVSFMKRLYICYKNSIQRTKTLGSKIYELCTFAETSIYYLIDSSFSAGECNGVEWILSALANIKYCASSFVATIVFYAIIFFCKNLLAPRKILRFEQSPPAMLQTKENTVESIMQ